MTLINRRTPVNPISLGFGPMRSTNPQIFLKLASSSPKFVEFLVGRERSDQARLLDPELGFELFFRRLLEEFSGAELERKQSKSLLKDLQHRGYEGSQTSGRGALESLSKENRDAILRVIRRGNEDLEIDLEITVLIDSLDFAVVHATGSSNYYTSGVPNLSTKTLENIGLRGGQHTQEFNTSVLKSHGNVFFEVYPVSEHTRRFPGTEFGDHSFVLNSTYAHQQGWVSPYTMTPLELEAVFGRMTGVHGINRGAIDQLHKLDLTLEDYIFLAREALKVGLELERKAKPDKYRASIMRLSDPDPLGGKIVLEEIGAKMMGFSLKAEFKVPVAVEPGMMTSSVQNLVLHRRYPTFRIED